jgi:hypothetical protein
MGTEELTANERKQTRIWQKTCRADRRPPESRKGVKRVVCGDLLRARWSDEESLLKLYYMALERIAKKWTMPIHNWSEALNRFAIEFGDRMPQLN